MAGAGAGAGVDVRVSRGEDGTVRIAVDGEVTAVDGEVAAVDGEVAAEEPDFTRAVLDVAGAVLTWPVLGTPGLLPSAEIHDPGRAQQWLWALYGERIAAAVHDRTTEDTTGSRPVYG